MGTAVDIVVAVGIAAVRTLAAVVVGTEVARIEVVAGTAVVVLAGYTVTAVYSLAAHTELDMVAAALDIVRKASHSPVSLVLLLRSLFQVGCHNPHRSAHLEHLVVRSWCRSYSVAERTGRLLRAYLLLALVFRNFDKIFCQ